MPPFPHIRHISKVTFGDQMRIGPTLWARGSAYNVGVSDKITKAGRLVAAARIERQFRDEPQPIGFETDRPAVAKSRIGVQTDVAVGKSADP